MSGMKRNLPKIFKGFEDHEFEVDGLVVSVLNNAPELVSRKTRKPFLVINGPSAGAGKDEIIKGLDRAKFKRVKTVTTREIVRDDERGGDPYIRMDKKKFKEQVEAGAFVEWIELADNFYGTRKAEVEEAILWEKTPVIRMDPRGAWRLAVMCREGTPPFDRVNLIAVM